MINQNDKELINESLEGKKIWLHKIIQHFIFG